MDPVTSSFMIGIMANACYSVLQNSSIFLKDKVKEKIIKSMTENSLNLPPIETLEVIVDKLALLEIDEDSSSKKISKEIEGNSDLVLHLRELEKLSLSTTQSVTKTVNIQNTGTGSIQFRDITQ
ncbi:MULTISPECIES: hypothetical protein [unclassified Acinetobacter]|uniref:hypothetical protein n=1 Tax=unclassified Acinetobacter TaxID=196816 RepID=UPI00257635DE|nr:MULTISPECIES: hypothetical protein [unclassified Acinetobacter]MDM1766030.1 hypothetical protein [Acinetobacter sp. 226-1]MDM1769784.1 hypothetical protein [Acinetobacter sp. 226-4]